LIIKIKKKEISKECQDKPTAKNRKRKEKG
jgi:hypothetical protein